MLLTDVVVVVAVAAPPLTSLRRLSETHPYRPRTLSGAMGRPLKSSAVGSTMRSETYTEMK
jgi:hypothetical protein